MQKEFEWYFAYNQYGKNHLDIPRSSYNEKICDGELLGCRKSHSFNCPIEFTVKISVVRK